MTDETTPAAADEAAPGPATAEDFLSHLLGALREGMEGPPAGQEWTTFLDSGGANSLLRTLDRLPAERAFAPLPIGPRAEGRTRSLAADVYHIAFGMHAFASWLRRDGRTFAWSQSFDVDSAFPAGGSESAGDADARWQALLDDLKAGYQDTREAMQAHARDGGMATAAAVGSVAHLAYHLGVVRARLHQALEA